MRKLIDLTGQRFGRLLVIRRVECEKHGEAKWLCQCDCGNETAVFGYLLRSGKTSSCGCSKHDETFRNKKKEQSTVHGGRGTRLYRIWIGMKNRCYNPNGKMIFQPSEFGLYPMGTLMLSALTVLMLMAIMNLQIAAGPQRRNSGTTGETIKLNQRQAVLA